MEINADKQALLGNTSLMQTAKASGYLKMFATKNAAMSHMRMKNQSTRSVAHRRPIFVVCDGPSDDYAVMDLKSAIELGALYTWEV